MSLLIRVGEIEIYAIKDITEAAWAGKEAAEITSKELDIEKRA